MLSYLVGNTTHTDPALASGFSSQAASTNASPRARSEAALTDASDWTANSQSQENSPSRYSARSQSSCRSAYSEATSCASTSSSAVKTRQINNLKLEVEMRDHRIAELETGMEDTRRQAECMQGELAAKLEEQTHVAEKMSTDHTYLKGTIEEQQRQLADMKAAHEALMSTFQQMAQRCTALEQQAQEERRAKEQAERFIKERDDMVAREAHERKMAVVAEEDGDFEMLVAEAKMGARRAMIAERARIQIEEEEAALMQQALARQRAIREQQQQAQQAQQQQSQQRPLPAELQRHQQQTAIAQRQMQQQQPQQQQQQQRGPVPQQQQARPGQPQQQQPEGKKCVIA